MMQAGDHELLRAFFQDGNEDAFRQLVTRHLGMVHGVAVRMLRDPALAEDVAQNTFVVLARKGGAIGPRQTLAGWLYQTARHQALHVLRTEHRRRQREEAAATMQTTEDREDLAPVIEALEFALGKLKPAERDVLVLRFLEERPLREVGRELGVSEDAARMKVNRALDKMRRVFERCGLAVSGGALTSAMLSEARATVPEGLREAVLSAALANAVLTGGVTGTATAELFGWLNLKTAVATIGAVALVGAGIYWLSEFGPRPPDSAAPPQLADESATGLGAAATADGEPAGLAPADAAAGPREGEEPPSPAARALVEQALLMLAQSRYEDARALVNQAVELSPRYPEAYWVRGKALFGLRLLSADELSPTALSERELFGLDQPDSAEANFTRAIELRPGYVEAWVERSKVYAELRQHDLVIRDCTRAIEIDPEFAPAWLGRGEAHYHGNDHARALTDLDRALELDGSLAEGYHFRALIYLARDEPEKALENRRLAVEVEPENAEQHSRLGHTLREAGRVEESLTPLSRALELDPALSRAYHVRSLALARLNRVEEAVVDLSNHLRLEPQHHNCFAQRGRLYLRVGDLERALADFNHSLRLAQDQARTYANRGHTYARLGRFEEALVDFEQAMKLRPNYEYALLQSAWAHEQLGNVEHALSKYSEALEINPDDAQTQARIDRLKGQTATAQEETP